MAIIWTNHVRERIRQRGLAETEVDRTLRFPDTVKKGKNSQTFYRAFGGYRLIVAVKRQGNDWVLASAWKKPGGQREIKPTLLERLIHRGLLALENLFRGRS